MLVDQIAFLDDRFARLAAGAAGLTATMPEAAHRRGRVPDPAARHTHLGASYYRTRTGTSRKLCNHIRLIQALGLEVTLTIKTP